MSQERLIRKSKEEVSETLIGPYEQYCDGYSSRGGNGYICPITLHTRILEQTPPLSHVKIDKLYQVNSNVFGLAGATGAYLDQINIIKVSSFCGPMGFIWGLDLATHNKIRDKKEDLLLDWLNLRTYSGESVKVYEGSSLLEASESLLGTCDKKHFPLKPGAHVPCAYTTYLGKPTDRVVYCGLAVGGPTSPDNASVFMEIAGGIGDDKNEGDIQRDIQSALAASVIEVGRNQGIQYKDIYVCCKVERVPPGKIGIALPAVPYLLLAKRAVPQDGISALTNLTLSEWLRITKQHFVTPEA